MAELLRRGTKDMKGADRLAAEVNRRRRELLNRNNLDGTLQEIKTLLDEAVLTERKELARALDDDARFAELQIESLSPSPAKAVQELSDYQWRSPQAREKYDQIKDLLGREMLDQRFAGMKEALENATDEDRQRVNDMLDDLNELLDKHSKGQDSPEDFQDFMAKHDEMPGPTHAFFYFTLWTAIEAIDLAGTDDPAAVAAAARSGELEWESPSGPCVIGTDGETSLKGHIVLVGESGELIPTTSGDTP